MEAIVTNPEVVFMRAICTKRGSYLADVQIKGPDDEGLWFKPKKCIYFRG